MLEFLNFNEYHITACVLNSFPPFLGRFFLLSLVERSPFLFSNLHYSILIMVGCIEGWFLFLLCFIFKISKCIRLIIKLKFCVRLLLGCAGLLCCKSNLSLKNSFFNWIKTANIVKSYKTMCQPCIARSLFSLDVQKFSESFLWVFHFFSAAGWRTYITTKRIYVLLHKDKS